jgi:LPS export ABC transporter protein LptC/lipopolysaccharide transport protein LptA
MTVWQRRLRVGLGLFAIAFAVLVIFAIRERAPAPAADPVVATDPTAIVQSTGGRIERFTLSREDVSVEYETQLTYADGSTKMMGVKVITTERDGGRTFTITGREGQLGQNESTIRLDGDVRLESSDGFAVRTEHATYADADGLVRAEGPVEFSRERLTGSGVGMTYDKNQDALTILDRAVVDMSPDAGGGGGLRVSAGMATFARREHLVRFEKAMRVERGAQVIEADRGIAYLTADEQQLDTVALRGSARITVADPAPGALQTLAGESMDLTYLPDGATLERALIDGGSTLALAGGPDTAGRRIEARTIEITLAPDGVTLTSLDARQGVVLTLPGGAGSPSRTIRSDDLDASGEGGKGLTTAHFAGSVDYREAGSGTARTARSRSLDVVMQPGTGEIDDARFAGSAHFEEGAMRADAAAARYAVAGGTLELTGSEPTRRMPRVVNERITVNAVRIDVTLAGPRLKAQGSVRSELQPAAASSSDGGRLPSMLEQDQPVHATADALDYDGAASRAVYSGNAQLWQGDTSIKGGSIALDDKSGDLTADGPATTTTMLEQTGRDKGKERKRTVGSAARFTYEEQTRRATYTGDAQLSGPQGDMRAERIELHLKPSGNELDRAEGYDSRNALSLREQSRTTTGSRMTYTAADDRYVITGTPVKIVDECGRETTGRTLTFHRATDTIVVDGNGFRTQTKAGAGCR